VREVLPIQPNGPLVEQPPKPRIQPVLMRSTSKVHLSA